MTEPVPEGGVARRELILASAGSGKTYRLSSRLIDLLAADVPPGEILASTFTRKAAGEIVDRVLLRLAHGALAEEAATELRTSMIPGASADRLTPEGCGALLVQTVRSLHRLQVHTLDAFFHRVAHSFSQELGLPERWGIMQEPDRERLRSLAVEEALLEMDAGTLLELVRMISRGGADRGVHRLLMQGVGELHALFRELDPGVPDPWGFEGGEASFAEVDENELDAIVDALERADLPLTRSGRVDVRWERARALMVRALRGRDWEAFLGSGLVSAVLGGGPYCGREIPAPIRDLHPPLFRMARGALGGVHQRRIAAMGRFLPEFHRRALRLGRGEGMLHFDDLTHALAAGGELGRRDELFYRLDGRIRHVLLDEFQDTSNAQWTALEPLVGEILSGYEGERAVFIVADPKQSIYGWRGGEPRIIDRISLEYGIAPGTMAKSWRSSQVVLDAVNEVFLGIGANPVLDADASIAHRWAVAFEPHRAARDLPGHVRVTVGPDEGEGKGRRFRPRLLAHAAAEVAELHARTPAASIGVLTCTNRSAAHVIAVLRALGIEASEEGGVPVADSGPVVALLALLRMADHPGDRVSRYLVARTPVGALLGFGAEDWRDDRRAGEVSRAVRERLLLDGYGGSVSDWTRSLALTASDRDRRRLRQLTELAFQWDGRATLRPADFVRMVESARAEDPATAAVRVMTIHGAKGLEFDAVVLPELDDLSFAPRGGRTHLSFRPGGTGPIHRIFPAVGAKAAPLFPELDEPIAQGREAEVRDSLSTLYVALTRAKAAVYLFLGPDPGGSSRARTGARVVREALAPGVGGEEGTVLWERGDPEWWRALGSPEASPEGEKPAVASGPPGVRTPRLRSEPRRRLLPRRAPSDLEGGRISLEHVLHSGPAGARDRGTLVHLWLERTEWWEDSESPHEEVRRAALLSLARERVPQVAEPERLLAELAGWVRSPQILPLLSRTAFPPGTRAERELSFLARQDGRIVQGTVDRMIRIPDGAGERLLIVDWKTDRVEGAEALAERLDFYRPQLEAYIRALSWSEGVALDRIEGVVAFLPAGVASRVRLT